MSVFLAINLGGGNFCEPLLWNFMYLLVGFGWKHNGIETMDAKPWALLEAPATRLWENLLRSTKPFWFCNFLCVCICVCLLYLEKIQTCAVDDWEPIHQRIWGNAWRQWHVEMLLDLQRYAGCFRVFRNTMSTVSSYWKENNFHLKLCVTPRWLVSCKELEVDKWILKKSLVLVVWIAIVARNL